MLFPSKFKHVVLRTKTDPVLIILRSVFLYANLLDLFCFKCMLHKQTLQGLPAYLNMKHHQNVLENVPIMFSKDKTITL